MTAPSSAPALPLYQLQFDTDSHTYWLDGEVIPSVTQIMTYFNIINTERFTEAARIRGSWVHRLTEAMDADEDVPFDALIRQGEEESGQELRGYLEAYQSFRDTTQFQPYLREHRLASVRHRYAGTLDMFGFSVYNLALFDLKTGGYEPWHKLQLAGYNELLAENGFAGKDAPERFGTVQLKPDGKFKIFWLEKALVNPKPQELTLSTARSLFMSAVQLYNFKFPRR